MITGGEAVIGTVVLFGFIYALYRMLRELDRVDFVTKYYDRRGE